MSVVETKAAPKAKMVAPAWNKTVTKYKHSDLRKSCSQIATSVVPFLALWGLMIFTYSWSIWVTLLLTIPTAGFLVRIFIIQHDCGHHSFFRNNRANDVLGFLCGVATLTPYHFWRRTHARHHVTSGNLDHRGHGDVGILTVKEYQARGLWGRLAYQIYRNPLFMFFFGASFMFLIQHRITRGVPKSWNRERMSVYMTNLALLAILVVAWATIGLKAFLIIELPVVILSAAAGSWLFFVQHQYEDAYWQPGEDWDFTNSALDGSSYYRLPTILRWFSGNIGYHHIHHLNSRIPNYYLPNCYDEEPEFRRCVTLGIRESIKCVSFKLWDEDQQRMVTFAQATKTKAA